MGQHFSLRTTVGMLVLDLPRFLWAMRPTPRSAGAAPWVYVRDRRDRLVADSGGRGVRCDWEWLTPIRVATALPVLGLLLMRRSLLDWPVRLRDEPAEPREQVQVSFVIGHRGLARLPNLLFVLRSIAAQRGVGVECIVVEQSEEPEIRDSLPAWVRYVHTLVPPGMPYARSWAFNVGARLARGDVLVFHDNDMVVPEDYAAELLARHREGYEVIDVKRFIFYLSERATARMFRTGELRTGAAPETVEQNAEGGGSVGVSREAHFAVGGFDEGFVGWGGEDNEHWQRLSTRRVWPYTYMPLLHLWHAAQPGKLDPENPTNRRFYERSAVPVEERIRELGTLTIGDPLRFADSTKDRGDSGLAAAVADGSDPVR